MPEQQPTPVILVVAVLLGLALLASIGGAIFLSATSHPVPDYLVATGSGALGALGALLVRPA